jgi:holin-like protein
MKKVIKTVGQIALLYAFYLIGKEIQLALHIPIPGSMIAMLLLFSLLVTNIIKEEWLLDGGQFLLSHLPLLFVPATVGIMDYFHLFQGRGILSIVTVIISTIIVMISAGAIGQWSALRQEKQSRVSQQTTERIEAS